MEPYKKKKTKEIKKTKQNSTLIKATNFLWRGTVTLVSNCAEFSLGNLQAAALVYKICLLEGKEKGKKKIVIPATEILPNHMQK